MMPSVGVEWFRDHLMRWSEGNLRSFPWREPDATFYEVFMAEMFLRRTRADVVKSVIPDFLRQYPTMAELAEAYQHELAEIIRPMGLQNTRSQGLIALSGEVDGSLPRSAEALRQLPQVGPYVANATLCFAEGAALPIVDRNVERVYSRYFGDTWAEADTASNTEMALAIMDVHQPRQYNLGLLDFAAAICRAREPRCSRCPVAQRCLAVA